MAGWLYKAESQQGKKLDGRIEANSKDEAMTLLRKRRLRVQDLKKEPMQLNLKLGTGVGSKDLATFTRQFAVMNSAGLSLLECLTILEEQTENPSMKKVVHQVSMRIQGGGTLAEALGQHPKIFDSLYCNMVAAGEAGGILDGILLRLAEYQENSERLKRKVKGALTYPAIIVVVAILVVGILLTFVVPKFAEIFSQGGMELPGPTLMVVGVSNFLSNNLLFIIFMIVVGFVALARFYKTPPGRMAIDKLKLKAPVYGSLEIRSGVARFSRTLGTLLRSGVSLLDGLEVTAKTVGNVVLEDALRKTQISIRGGNPMAEPLKACGLFPPMVVQMINVGEKTGAVGDMLSKVADFYDEEVDAAVETLTSMIEPIIIVVLGAVVGAILVAMYLPMFSMSETVG